MTTGRHLTVLLEEAVQALAIRADGRYLDATFGRGGHSEAILVQLGPEGALLALDRDPEAVAHGRAHFAQEGRLVIRQSPFSAMAEVVADLGWPVLDGVLMDLGVSSPQLDEAQRGFSFLRDGPLDMRMDPDQGESAASWINRVPEMELLRVFREYGEERFAKRIAAAIVTERRLSRFETTGHLAEVISKAHPAWEKGKHPATRCFQAIRIHINGELEELRVGLDAALELLRPGGRLAVISFHSLEDRMVKRFIRDQARGQRLPPGLPVRDEQLGRRLRPVGSSIRPGERELTENPRARSAVLRVAEKI